MILLIASHIIVSKVVSPIYNKEEEERKNVKDEQKKEIEKREEEKGHTTWESGCPPREMESCLTSKFSNCSQLQKK